NNGEDAPIFFYRDKDKIEIDLLIEQDNTLYPLEIKKTATPKSDDAKNFFITSRIKNVQIAQSIIVCNTNKVSSVKRGETSAFVIPVEFL
ncbi:MAG: DUF4143 domain-containing protein, partial [Treponema sp.]|nr:DUF4143 domain-containing protein [Treponema sp.]